VISIPLGFFAGIGRASRSGVLIKGGNYLEALNQIEIVVFDKTGTLTKGNFKVSQLHVHDGLSQNELLKLAAQLESFSNHPIAKSIVDAYDGVIDQSLVTELKEIAGEGIKAVVSNQTVFVGNKRLMEREEIDYQMVESSGTLIYLAVDGLHLGTIVIEDEIKQDAALTIKLLKKMGIKKTVMLSGDQKIVANAVSKHIEIDEVHAELLPQDKLEIMEALLKTGKVLYVGDGINDTPVLARADIGVAMGGLGSDAAIEVSDIVIMNDEISKLISALKIAKSTKLIVWQNIVFALGVKAFFLIFGAFGYTTMWEAVFADVGVSILAILNSFRLFRIKKLY
jgi:Cd2+/Zn2+-exporting ATPase